MLTATDAAAARTALGVTGVSAGAIADLSNGGDPANAFHLLEPAGAFADHGSAPQTLTVTGAFRRARLGPRALIPAVWPPVSAVGSLSFPASIGYNGPFSVGLTIRGNGEAPPSGSILQATSGGSVRHEVFFSDPANLNARIFSTAGPVWGGTPFAIDTSTSHRIVYTFAYPGGAVWMDGALGTAVFGYPNDLADMMLCLVDCAGISACDFDFWPGVVLTTDEIAADFERYASSFRY
ncbi:MAG: hypothetical protein IPJ61_20220 [Tessaracoccus sp.]|uniref:hypothetical protein n=1 Tax=Tessaracoccus sp. TaxID=1971211 RepID=UPI001EC6D6DB|nr:hypothetical protein [Tessaracoccus sp.]MBK7823314.1 hypothetical protein [Tessaracoccus sp.]